MLSYGAPKIRVEQVPVRLRARRYQSDRAAAFVSKLVPEDPGVQRSCRKVVNIMSNEYALAATLVAVAFVVATLYIMRRRVRQGRRVGKF